MAMSDDSTRDYSGDTHKEIQLVEKAISGNSTAFHMLVDRYHEAIYRMAFYRTRSEMDAEDITQEVFLQAYRYLTKLKDKKKFKSWLFRIAINRVKDFYRKKRIQKIFQFSSADEESFETMPEVIENPEAEDLVLRKDFWKHTRKMLNKLSSKEKEAFLLRFFDQLSIKEITQVMNKKESTVKTFLYRAIAKLKADLSKINAFSVEIMP